MLRKRILAAASILMIISPLARAENLKEIDARKDKGAGDYFVIFCSNATDAAKGIGYAFACVGKGSAAKDAVIESAYGLQPKDGKPTIAALTPEKVTEVRKMDGKPGPSTLFVRIDAKQYEAVKATFKEYAAKDVSQTDPGLATLNFSVAVKKGLPLKAPYVSGLSGPNPLQYYGDLYQMNGKR